MDRQDRETKVVPISGEDEAFTRLGDPTAQLEVGQWYWVLDKKNPEDRWLGCVMHIGSNFVKLQGPRGNANSYPVARIHFDNVAERLLREQDPAKVIRDNTIHYQQEVQTYLDEVREVTARLGMSSQTAIPHASRGGTALAVMSGQVDIKQYQNALVLAKEKTLPDLFEKIKKANEEMSRWMSAEMLPMQAASEGMKGSIGQIEDRIFNVSLYAGLVEQVIECCDGEPAQFHEKLHVMQRKLYMDEECLLDYGAGGIDIQSIEKFDEWISQPHNRDRILPFNRCIVAMQVRRHTKEREWNGSLRHLKFIVSISASDKRTYLFIRNGERVYRLTTELEFDELIFPDAGALQPDEPMMVRMLGDRVDRMMTAREYESRVQDIRLRKRLAEKWAKENPTKKEWDNPHRHIYSDFRPREWDPLDPSNVFFDECEAYLQAEIKKYNRIALIIQGLFDRSEVLHPHPPVKSWTPQGFAAAIELVADGSKTLTYGEAPDFEAYRSKCNESLREGSTVVGQHDYWLRKEGEKESARRDRDYRFSHMDHRPTRYQPHGNPGPGLVATIGQWKQRARTAVFRWERERQCDSGGYYGRRAGSPIPVTLSVPAAELLNIDAYQLGDYRQFFQDPRTREQYLKWAPLLLEAEAHHLAKLNNSTQKDST